MQKIFFITLVMLSGQWTVDSGQLLNVTQWLNTAVIGAEAVSRPASCSEVVTNTQANTIAFGVVAVIAVKPG